MDGFLGQMTDLSMIWSDRHLSVGFPFIQDPPGKTLIRLHITESSKSRNIRARGWQLELLRDHGDLVDHIRSGAVTASDLVLLDDLESLSWDPVITCQELSHFVFTGERSHARAFLYIFD